MSFPPPREFQAQAHEALRQGVRDGKRAQLMVAATGGGKTYLGLRACAEALAKGRRATFLCDRRTLVDQTSKAADAYGLRNHGVYMANHWRFRPSEPLQIASVQTIAARGGEWPRADVLIVDEAHTMHKTWTEHVKSTASVVIGLTATPFSVGLGRLFDGIVNATTMDKLTKDGVLVPMRVLACVQADMANAKTIAGEWSDKVAAERGMAILGDVVSAWLEHAQGLKTICFGATIAHCEELCRSFNEAGVMAAVFTAHTSDSERAELLKEYAKPDSALRVLISVEALAKGFDVPDVGCVIDCRPLRKSFSTYVQMIGRGLRSSPATGKTECVVLDHSGNALRFRADMEELFFEGVKSLDDGEKKDKKPREEPDDEQKEKACPSCGYKPFARRCMSCGFVHAALPEIDATAGVMTEVVMCGGKVAGANKADLWAQVCAYARSYSRPEKQQGRAAHLYRDIVGAWPPREWRVETTPPVPVSRVTLNEITRRNIAFKKATGIRREACA